MAYNMVLAERIRKVLKGKRGVTEKAMFGGLAFLLNGKMFVGIVHDDLMVRVNPDETPKLLEKKDVRPMDFTGRPMKGYLYAGSKACKTDAHLKFWIGKSTDFVRNHVLKKTK